MVRKTTRSVLKASEKSKPESPRRGSKTTNRNKRSSSNSEDSEEDITQKVNKNISPSHADRGSSDNESDKDSKKPLKKRTRSMAVNEEIPQSVPRSKSSRWDKQPKSPPIKTDQQDKGEEVKEEQNSKGKSKNKNISSNDNVVTPKIENENVQVTDESPSDVKDDDHDTLVKNGQNKVEIDVNIIKTIDSENAPDRQSSEITPDQPEELSHQSDMMLEKSSQSPSKGMTEKLGSSENQSKKGSEGEERKLVDKDSSEQSKDLDEQKPKKEGDGKSENSKKIRLKRPSNDKRASESEDKKEDGLRKRITLKRPESKPILEESKAQVENDEAPQNEEWSSSYETTNEKTKQDKQEIHEEQATRKRITLKRSKAEDKKHAEKDLQNLSGKKEISLGRSVSLVEHKKEESDNTNSNGIRRRSSALERSVSETEVKPEPPKKPTKVVKLNRVISKESQEPLPPGEETLKKFKWGQSDLSYTSIHTLNLETLKESCPTIEFLKEDEVSLEIVVKDNKITPKERRKTFTELEEEEMEKIEAELNAEPEEIEIKENIIAMNRKISIVDDTASKMRPPPSPAKNPVSEVLFITNLVRPFTVKQLKELLERTGKIREDGFWTDRIKSKCYVYYEKAEEAEATRNALHGVNWPIGNGKKLIIDYATVEDLENAKKPPIPVKREKTPEKENKKPFVPDEKDDKQRSRSDKREWDLGKEEDHRRRRSRSRSRERQRKHSRRSYTPEDYHTKKRKHEEPVPQKAMDDLFLKTKATPSIYWQPLSPEEIALKQQQRLARLEENKRRLEEISSRTATRGTRDRGRDRNFRRR